MKPVGPMAAVRGMSPAFATRAIALDVALAAYRDIAAFEWAVHDACESQGIPTTVADGKGGKADHPFITELWREQQDAMGKVFALIQEIAQAKPVTAGDRRLKKLALHLPGCPRYRQIDAMMVRTMCWDGSKNGT